MRIAYIAHSRFPTEKAYGHQMAQVCHALSSLGHEVTLTKPHGWNAITENAASYYGLPASFEVVELPSFDALSAWYVPEVFAMLIGMHSYRGKLCAFFETRSFDLLYVRSPLVLDAALSSGIPVILEFHALPKSRTSQFVDQCNACARVVCLTTAMKEELLSWGVRAENVIVEGDGVDTTKFADLPSKEDARSQWDLPSGKPVLGYTGSLYTQTTIEKGITQMLIGFMELKKRGVPFFGWIVGGSTEECAVFIKKAQEEFGLTSDDVRFEGHVHAHRVPSAIAACDVCLYPAPQSDHPFFQRDTSPLKLFEYLAARRPVVCADLPPVRDAVDESVVTFVIPGDGVSLADGVEDVLRNLQEERIERGFQKAKQYDWKERMKRIVSSL